LHDIEQARDRIRDAVINTPFNLSRTLSEIHGSRIYLKFENMQFTASFKERGALNKLLQLTDEEKNRGVIAMSAGNHAKAVAYHGQRLGIPVTIVMPRNTPTVKVEDTQNFAAEVVLTGLSLDEAASEAHRIAEQRKLVFVHPFDDDAVIAGQGTVALEMLEKQQDLDCIVVPIGGGGLISGIAVAAKAINPDIRIIGVEAAGYPSVANRLRGAGEIRGGSTIAEGIAVKHPGERTMAIIEKLVDDVIIVDDELIEEAINTLLTIEKTVAEGAGAAALAAVMSAPERFAGLRCAVMLCGANIDTRILASVLMRRLVRKGRIVRYRIKISDLPGTLAEVSAKVGQLGGNILEVSHQRMFGSIPVKDADLYLTVETRDHKQSEQILAALLELGYNAKQVLDEDSV
jgi:threonine dehydratase